MIEIMGERFTYLQLAGMLLGGAVATFLGWVFICAFILIFGGM